MKSRVFLYERKTTTFLGWLEHIIWQAAFPCHAPSPGHKKARDKNYTSKGGLFPCVVVVVVSDVRMHVTEKQWGLLAFP